MRAMQARMRAPPGTSATLSSGPCGHRVLRRAWRALRRSSAQHFQNASARRAPGLETRSRRPPPPQMGPGTRDRCEEYSDPEKGLEYRVGGQAPPAPLGRQGEAIRILRRRPCSDVARSALVPGPHARRRLSRRAATLPRAPCRPRPVARPRHSPEAAVDPRTGGHQVRSTAAHPGHGGCLTGRPCPRMGTTHKGSSSSRPTHCRQQRWPGGRGGRGGGRASRTEHRIPSHPLAPLAPPIECFVGQGGRAWQEHRHVAKSVDGCAANAGHFRLGPERWPPSTALSG